MRVSYILNDSSREVGDLSCSGQFIRSFLCSYGFGSSEKFRDVTSCVSVCLSLPLCMSGGTAGLCGGAGYSHLLAQILPPESEQDFVLPAHWLSKSWCISGVILNHQKLEGLEM